nr:MAG TPA: Protein of unknown function (DUF3920) [Caudoviricetes sp.]
MEVLLEERKTSRRKVKTWGENGFTGKIQYGCYDYDVRFVPMTTISKMLAADKGSTSIEPTCGCICCDEQTIYIASDMTKQLQKLSLMHELVHMIFLNNNVGSTMGSEEINVASEDLVDNTASRLLQVIKRNPEAVRWLSK